MKLDKNNTSEEIVKRLEQRNRGGLQYIKQMIKYKNC